MIGSDAYPFAKAEGSGSVRLAELDGRRHGNERGRIG
jgi:hypothetical protein